MKFPNIAQIIQDDDVIQFTTQLNSNFKYFVLQVRCWKRKDLKVVPF